MNRESVVLIVHTAYVAALALENLRGSYSVSIFSIYARRIQVFNLDTLTRRLIVGVICQAVTAIARSSPLSLILRRGRAHNCGMVDRHIALSCEFRIKCICG